jgi:methionyl-tRNA formyltransferase
MKRLAILCQEEPIFLGPFLQEVVRMHPDRIAAVFVAGRRSAGEPRRTLKRKLTSLVLLFRLFECPGFLHAVLLRLRAAAMRRHDAHSVEHTAHAFGIPVHHVHDPNSPAFHNLLHSIAPDAVLNQSEKLLKPNVLAIPPLGFINRHASLLPRFRGRMAAFWAHAAEPPSYGLTIHLVDEGIDTGPIILQREFRDIDTRWPYPRVMQRIMHTAPALFWTAWDRLNSPGFTPLPNTPVDEPRRFPTTDDVKAYRETMKRRRKAGRLKC